MNYLDRVIGYFNPEAALKRVQARHALQVSRDYEINSKSYRNDGWKKLQSAASSEVSKAFIDGAAAGQELCRNNPLAFRMKQAWAANAVGGGIVGQFSGKNKRGNKAANTAFTDWAESTLCDLEGHYNFYGLQWLWMNTIVESGGVLVRKVVNTALNFPLQLQTIEQTYLDTSKTGAMEGSDDYLFDGIQYKPDGSIRGYWINQHVNDSALALSKVGVSKFFPAEDMIHIFRKDRAGQHVGMTWFAANGTMLKNHDVYVDAKLMQQKIAACFGAILTNPAQQSGLGTSKDGYGNEFDSIEPATINYVEAGTEVTTLTPPKADNSAEFDVSLQRTIAVGGGITYEMLTGDYSRVNFASGRMGKTEFFSQLDYVQKLMLKPALDKIANWFLVIGNLKSGASIQHKIEWTFPPRAAVNPQEEFDVMFAKVRAGLMSPSEAAQQLGTKLEVIVQRWKDDKALFEQMGLKFDIDPAYFARTGNQLDDNDAASANSGSSAKAVSGDSNKVDKKSGKADKKDATEDKK